MQKENQTLVTLWIILINISKKTEVWCKLCILNSKKHTFTHSK